MVKQAVSHLLALLKEPISEEKGLLKLRAVPINRLDWLLLKPF
jgi:hypothetical protein